MPNFGDLPPEVLDHILSFLAVVEPPSSAFLYEQPSTSMVKSDFQPLKNLSRTCQSMRCCTFKNLFKHTKVRLTAEYLPESQARLALGTSEEAEMAFLAEKIGMMLKWSISHA